MNINLKHKNTTKKIIGAAFEVHKFLGNGFQEVVYQRALAIEMQKAGLEFVREIKQDIYYKDFPKPIGTRRADEEKNRNYGIEKPRNPQNRIIAQKSIFVWPPKGFIEPEHFVIIDIPKLLKEPMLNHLQKQHDTSTKTVYNDLHGFIRNQSDHQGTYIEVYKSETAQHKDFLLQDRS